jgi:general secretion pathway protein E
LTINKEYGKENPVLCIPSSSRAGTMSKAAATTPQLRHHEVRFLDFLESRGLIDSVAAGRVAAAKSISTHTDDVLILELGLLPETKLADAEAEFLELARAYPESFPDTPIELEGIQHRFLREKYLLPMGYDGKNLILASARPFDQETLQGLSFFLGAPIEVRVATGSEVQGQLRRLFVDAADEAGPAGSTVHEGDVERLRDAARDQPTVKLLNRIVAAAIAETASDIHIEPQDDLLRVRFRIDGALRIYENLPIDASAGLVSRIKILARLNIAEHRLSQDGRLRLAVRGRDVDFRVSTTPTVNGESVALRILDRHELPLDFGSLGFSLNAIAQLQRLSRLPNGIVLVTGPTGSGKTTTLYAALKLLNHATSKVFTVEDPIEYQLAGANQIQVNPLIGFDFAHVLRSVLRQDPDVIMIGEIRDLETAKIAIQAALTGHLVLSTLHTNSAVATLTRLSDMGLEKYLVMSCLNGVVAQRLVRRLCNSCKTEMILPAKMADELGLSAPVKVWKPCGCERCGGTGYRGRIVAYEILEITPAIRQAMSRQATPDEIEALAQREGMQPLYHQAMGCALAGDTSVEEVLRVLAGLDQ